MKRWQGLFLVLVVLGIGALMAKRMMPKAYRPQAQFDAVRVGMTQAQAIETMDPTFQAVGIPVSGWRAGDVSTLVWRPVQGGPNGTIVVEYRVFLDADGRVTRKLIDGREVE